MIPRIWGGVRSQRNGLWNVTADCDDLSEYLVIISPIRTFPSFTLTFYFLLDSSEDVSSKSSDLAFPSDFFFFSIPLISFGTKFH